MSAVERTGFSTPSITIQSWYGRPAEGTSGSRSTRCKVSNRKGHAMTSQHDDKSTRESGAPTSVGNEPKRRKLTWKSVAAAVIALVILWQIYHALTNNSGGGPVAGGGRGNIPTHAGQHTSVNVPRSNPTPTPTVTLGGRRVPVGGGPLIVLNPGQAAPGSQFGVDGNRCLPRT